jgi:hypothetical protein
MIVEKRLSVRRLPDTSPQLYQLSVAGFNDLAVKDIVLGQVLGLMLGTDASAPLHALLSGESSHFQARVWINAPQRSALEALMSAYEVELAP